jgi:methylglutaconyl-CoA hydratase
MTGETRDRITLTVEDGIATLTLNRPDKRNALDARTVHELTQAVLACDGDTQVHVMLLRGAGKDFCAGADLEQLQRIAAGASALENLDNAAALGTLFVTMRRASKPIVAAVHGHALAGGAGLATAADLIVASESATFGYPEVHLGFVPAMVTALLRRAVGEKTAFQLITLGESFSAREALRLGLVARVLADDGFADAAHAFAADLAKRSASAIRLCKRLLYGIDGASFEDAIARGAEVNVIARATPDCQDGVRRFLQKRS